MTVQQLIQDLGLTEQEILDLVEDQEFAEALEAALRLHLKD